MNPIPATSYLIIQSGAQAGQSIPLQMGTYKIGSEQTNQIVITDEQISPRHAQLTIAANGCWIADLSSSYGTFVNGSRIADGYGWSLSCP